MTTAVGRAQPFLALEELRGCFPALGRRHNGLPVAYFDGPGGTQVPQRVVDAVADYLLHHNANTHWDYPTSHETDAALLAARAALADYVNGGPDEIVFGANMTTLTFHVGRALGRGFASGDEIVVTELDHDANVAPWQRVAADHGLVVRTGPIRGDATLDADALEALLDDRTRIVAFTLASNAVGSLTDAPRIARAAHAAGALAWADGVHLAPHRRPDRRALGVDVLLCSPYKFFGPHLGVAAIRRDLAESWPADRVRPAGERPPGHRFETGTPSFEALAGLVAAIEYLASLGDDLDDAYARIRAHEEGLSRAVLARLADLPGVVVHGIADPDRVDERTPTFCFSVEGQAPRAVSERLAERGIFTWDGNYYALSLMEALGLQERGGAVRAGFLHYNTEEEAERLCDALGDLVSGAPREPVRQPRRDETPA
jgi:cysteine desulfurase family protein (TIGR01976 family)